MEAVKRQLDKGHQAFVVCPMISASEKMAGVKSVDDLTLEYSKYFNPLGYTVVSLTGKDKKADLEQKLQQFEEGSAQIMIATTVVEVGVNIPNATIMVIHNAERFGLSSLHQLRGRVGRSSFPSYCALVSTEGGANERLKIIETSNDGFAIAAADLQLRGPGEWLGEAQSGRSSLPAQLMIAYPTIYQSAKKAAAYLIDHYRTCDFVKNAIIETEE
jgi:ATP-dependent DNA helicase RecG